VVDPPEIFDPLFPPFKSLKVSGNDTDRSATYDFILTFHSNHDERNRQTSDGHHCLMPLPWGQRHNNLQH